MGCAAQSKWKGVVDVYARATTVRARPSALDDAIAMMRDDIMDDVTQMDGNIGLSMLADRDSGRFIVTSAWADQEAMRRSASAVKPLRDRVSELMGDTPTVQEWEIAVLHRRRPTDAGACARVTWLQGQSGDADRAIEVYRQKVLPALEEVDGFCSASLLVDRDTGRAVSTVTFQSRDHMERSSDMADRLRTSTAEETGSRISDVAEFDLVLAHLRVPETV